MDDPVHLEPDQFFEFIGVPGLSVVFVSLHPMHPFNNALVRRFRERYGDAVPFGTIGLMQLIARESPVLAFLRQSLVVCGVAPWLEVMPGYYVFHGGRALAWDSGLPTAADVQPILRGSLLGAFAFAFTRDPTILRKALKIAADEATAHRLTGRFHAAYEQRDDDRPRPPPRRPSGDDLRQAYRTLGVEPNASDAEIAAAWRKLGLQYHPDRAADDPLEFERRSRLSAEINRARDIIRSHRAKKAG
jgi:DnaJ-domain-containing protein 1